MADAHGYKASAAPFSWGMQSVRPDGRPGLRMFRMSGGVSTEDVDFRANTIGDLPVDLLTISDKEVAAPKVAEAVFDTGHSLYDPNYGTKVHIPLTSFTVNNADASLSGGDMHLPAGVYEIAVYVGMYASTVRSIIRIGLRINGANQLEQDVPSYIRNASNHNHAGVYLSKIVEASAPFSVGMYSMRSGDNTDSRTVGASSEIHSFLRATQLERRPYE